MRILLKTTASALLYAGAAHAEDRLLRADITGALVFGQGAEVTRTVDEDLAPGRHTLFIPMRDVGSAGPISVSAPDGVLVGNPRRLEEITIPEGALDTDAEAGARAAVRSAEDALQDARDRLALRDATLSGLELQLEYLTTLADGTTGAQNGPGDADSLITWLGTLGEQTARVASELATARTQRRADLEAIADLERALAEARRNMADLNVFRTVAPGISLDVEVAASGAGPLELTYLVDGARWSPSYDLRLDSEAAELAVNRSITLEYTGEATWRDVAMRFSSALPDRQREPSGIWPDPVRIAEDLPAPAVRSEADSLAVMEPVIGAAPAVEPAQLEISGLSVVYAYSEPVTILPGGQETLALDTLAFDVERENRAVPRRDRTAFLVALAENTDPAPILPGLARFFRDGELVGTDRLPLIPAGGEIEMAFGPLDHLPLIWRDLSLDEGERGVFVSENEQRRRIAFGVENTGSENEQVRVIYATPFAQQDALELSLGLSQEPDIRDLEDMQGVHAWDLQVAPGETARIEMEVMLRWPEGMVLDWRP